MKLSKEIGIDLGTANILIYVKGEGIVVNEPSVVTINTETNKPSAVGDEARDMLGKTPGKFQAIRTSNITSIEKSAIQDVALRCGAKRVYIEEEPKVAAIGAGLDISKPSGNMVVDIGGGTTDIAVLSLGDIVTSTSLKIAGDKMDAELIKYVKDKYKLLIGDRTAEEIKMTIGSAYEADPKEVMDVRGRDLVTGLPHTIQLNAKETQEALEECCMTILRSTKQVLEQTPPELSADIVNKGIFLTGGGALLHNLDKFLEEGLGVPVFVAENALDCVAEGCGVMLENTQYLQ